MNPACWTPEATGSRSVPVGEVAVIRAVLGFDRRRAMRVAATDHDRLARLTLGVALLQRLVADHLLQLDDPLEQRLGARGAARHVHVDRDDLVDALRDGIAVPE